MFQVHVVMGQFMEQGYQKCVRVQVAVHRDPGMPPPGRRPVISQPGTPAACDDEIYRKLQDSCYCILQTTLRNMFPE